MYLDRAPGVFEAGDDPEGGCLATPRRAEQGDYTALPHVEAEVVERHGIAERPGQVAGTDGETISR
jgi:hypothetical protein